MHVPVVRLRRMQARAYYVPSTCHSSPTRKRYEFSKAQCVRCPRWQRGVLARQGRCLTALSAGDWAPSRVLPSARSSVVQFICRVIKSQLYPSRLGLVHLTVALRQQATPVRAASGVGAGVQVAPSPPRLRPEPRAPQLLARVAAAEQAAAAIPARGDAWRLVLRCESALPSDQ